MTSSSKAAIAELLSEARERTLELIEPLDDEQLNRVYSPILSPLAWDLGHIANFEELWLVQTIADREPMRGDLGRFYDAIENPRRTRGELPILRDAELRSYMADVRERTLEVLDTVEIGPEAEDPLLQGRLRLRDAAGPRAPAQRDDAAAAADGRRLRAGAADLGTPPIAAEGPEMVVVEGGSYEIGAPGGGFAYDNERRRHPVELAPLRDRSNPGHQLLVYRFHGGDRSRAADVLGA